MCYDWYRIDRAARRYGTVPWKNASLGTEDAPQWWINVALVVERIEQEVQTEKEHQEARRRRQLGLD